MDVAASLQILDYMTKITGGSRRCDTLLRPADARDTPNWSMCVPSGFNEALDIKATESNSARWTQGSWFFFKEGDTLYDTDQAYQIWAEALKYINLCIHVMQGYSAKPANRTANRSPGYIHFCTLEPNADRSALKTTKTYEMTQDDFVRYLICGKA